MTQLRLPFIHEYRDRHGRVRRYFRRRGSKLVMLPGPPGSVEFMAAYQAALAGEPAPEPIGAARTLTGTVNAAVISYFNSATFGALGVVTRRYRRYILERFRVEHGDKRLSLLQRKHIERMIAAKAATPSAARNFLDALRPLMAHCITVGLIATDPTDGIKRTPIKTSGFATWSEDNIAAFERAHPIGSRARLAFSLLLYAGQRRSDTIRMGWQHIRGGILHVRQTKTGVELQIPIHPDLAEVLDAVPATNLTFLVTNSGAPFTPNGFGNLFRQWCAEARLPASLTSHGLRKACCRRLAESGCAANVIAAISGHTTLRMVEKYTKAADQAKMAARAINAMAAAFPSRRI